MNKFESGKIHVFKYLVVFLVIGLSTTFIFENIATANILLEVDSNNKKISDNSIVKKEELTSSFSAGSLTKYIQLFSPLAEIDLEMNQVKVKNQTLAVKDNFFLEYKLKSSNYEGFAYLGIYFSKDEVLDKADKSAHYEKLNIDQKNNSGEIQLTVPALPDGEYYIITNIDDQWGSSAISESDENNNIAVTNKPVEVVSPPVDIMASINKISADYNFLVVNYSLINLSDYGVGAWDAKIYFSTDQKIDAEDRIVASINENTAKFYLKPQGNLDLEINEVYLFPYEYLPAGDYYVLIDFNSSRTLPEINYDNNIGISQKFTINPYALSLNIDQVQTSPEILSSHANIPITLDWTNNEANSIDGLYFDLKIEITQAGNSAVSYHEQWVWLSSGDSESINIEIEMPKWIEGGKAVVTFSSDYTNTYIEKINIIPDFKNAEVLVENLSQIFDGSAKSVQVSTLPEGLTVEVFYNGSSDLPVNAGEYKVSVKIIDPLYKGEAEEMLKILPASATINISGTSVTYTGDPQQILISTEPAELPLQVLYNGSESLPVNAGKYDVEVMVKDPNYQSKATAEFNILAKEVTVSFSNLEHVYNGEIKNATVITTPEDLKYSVIYYDLDTIEKKPVNSGNYLIKAIGSEANYKLTAWATLKITKAQANFIILESSTVYNGSEQSIGIISTPSEVSFNVHYYDEDTNEVKPVNAGKYLVHVSSSDPNYEGENWGSFIVKPAIAIIFTDETEKLFDGQVQVPEYQSDPVGLSIKYEYFDLDSLPTEPVNAGKYLVKATIDEQNYIAEAWGGIIIDPATIDFSFAQSKSEYTGDVQNIKIIPSLPDIDYTITYWQNDVMTQPVNVGNYNVKVIAADKNYQGSAETTFTIKPAHLKFNFTQLQQEYTGGILQVQVNTEPAEIAVELSYFTTDSVSTTPLEAGIFLVKAISADANYVGSAWAKMEVTPAIADIVFEQLQHKYDGSAKKAIVYTNPAGLHLEVKYDGKDNFPTKAGTYEITANVADPSFKGNESALLEIAKADAEIMVGDLVFSNNEPEVSVTTFPSGLSYEMLFVMDGDTTTTIPTEPGEYKLIIEIADENFQGRLIKSMVITGGELLENEDLFSVYPNPVSDLLNFNISKNDLQVKLIDMNGRLIKNWELTVQKTIDLSFVPKGTYFIAVQAENKTYTKRILKL